jgi:hypothetical protein
MLVALRSRPSNDVLLSNAVRKQIPFYSLPHRRRFHLTVNAARAGFDPTLRINSSKC